MNQDFPEDNIQVELRGGLGVITLNRPAALNALSLDMIREIASILHQWQDNPKIKAVFFSGRGERAFCAGGDVKSFYFTGMDYRRGKVSARVPAVFFAEEYSMNKQIFHYPKPVISFMNGLTMGGGYGIAGNSKYRIATDKTIFAMPEVGIGLFPDVGSMYHLCRAKKAFGRYLALTGENITGADMVHSGLAEYYMKSTVLKDLLGNLEKSDDIASVLSAHSEALPDSGFYTEYGDAVSALFTSSDVAELASNLKNSGTKFGTGTLSVIESRSPTSVMVTAAHFKRAEKMDFDTIIATDFTLTQNFIRTADLYEGIRAQLIDRDRMPRWTPPTLAEVDTNDVNTYFTPTGYDLKDVQIFES